jgi:hypothetical protein
MVLHSTIMISSMMTLMKLEYDDSQYNNKKYHSQQNITLIVEIKLNALSVIKLNVLMLIAEAHEVLL